MPDYGLTETGLVVPTIADLRTEAEASFRAEFGSLPLGDRTWLGHLLGIHAERVALVWEGLEAILSSTDPDKASGLRLRALGLLTGTFELAALPSTVTLTLCGDDGTLVATGSVASSATTGARFATTADATIAVLGAWAATTAYALGARVSNAARCYVCTTAGTSAGAGGPTTTADAITDNTVVWRYLGEGLSAVDVAADSEALGEVPAVAGDVTSIETPVAGWSSVRNLADAELGREVQTDEGFRLLREAQLASSGKAPADAVRAALLAVPDVTNVTVFFNNTDEVDADGLPPNSVEALVQGGDADLIRRTLWDCVAVGIGFFGDEVGNVDDSEGFPQEVRFSRPEEVTIWVEATLVKDPDTYGGDDAVVAAVVAWGDAQNPGKNAVASAISAQVFAVNGVLDVTSLLIGVVDPPVASTTVAISRRQLATYDTSRVTVTSSDGEP